jgi:DNA-binding NarL/FixJ family response regulator
VEAVSAADPTGPLARAAEHVAVVATDDLMVQRIREALAHDEIEVSDRAVDVAGLTTAADGAVAIVVARGKAGRECHALIRDATARFHDQPVVLIGALTPIGVHKALDAGAAGFVLESEVESTLSATIRAVRAGQLAAPRNLRRSVVRPALSPRERQIVALLVMGFTNNQIAERLFLAESTVKTHLTSIFNKLGVSSRSEAVAVVLDREQRRGHGILGLSLSGSPRPAVEGMRS